MSYDHEEFDAFERLLKQAEDIEPRGPNTVVLLVIARVLLRIWRDMPEAG